VLPFRWSLEAVILWACGEIDQELVPCEGEINRFPAVDVVEDGDALGLVMIEAPAIEGGHHVGRNLFVIEPAGGTPAGGTWGVWPRLDAEFVGSVHADTLSVGVPSVEGIRSGVSF